MFESLGKTLRGKLERNIKKKKKRKENTEKILKAETGKKAQFTTIEVKFHNPMKKNKHCEK